MFAEMFHEEKKLNTFKPNNNKYFPNSYNLICILILFYYQIFTFGNCKINNKFRGINLVFHIFNV
jgi:hypothetical protein